MSSSTDLTKIIENARRVQPDPGMARRAISLLDLTSLRGDETDEDVSRLCSRAIAHGTAAVCVYPTHLATARRILSGAAVQLATVANFPEGGDDIVAAADEVEEALSRGADEVDIVAPVAAIRAGDVSLVGELVEACRGRMGADKTLKVILETGALSEPDLITAAARSAVMAGADFLKTSTGKELVGATPEAVAALLAVSRDAQGKVGVKVSGGIRAPEDAALYLALAENMLGTEWVNRNNLRIGASSLLDALVTLAERH